VLICISAAFSTVMLDCGPGNSIWASMAATATATAIAAIMAAAVTSSFRSFWTDTISH
jgi:hypothetical protein